MALDKNLLEAVKAGLAKQAFVPAPAGGDPAAGGGMPPMDPAAMAGGGMPPVDPATGMPLDPSMMAGGAMPPPPGGDPAAAGGMPPTDPLAGAGAAGDIDPNTGEPYIKLTFKQLFSLIDQILKLATKLGGNGQQGQQQQAAPAPADNGNQELVNEVRNLVTAITAR